MENKNLRDAEEENNEFETKISRNDDANPHDSAVVIEEEARTVLLTEDETIIIEKEETYSIAPKNRPRKVYAGMWGVPEIVTVGLASLAVLTCLLIYLFFVLPSKKELEQNRAKRDQLEKDLVTANNKYGNIQNTETEVAKLITSVNDFESRFLKNEEIGKSAIYQRLNGLINAYDLTNTTGPDYVPLEITEDERRRGIDSESQRGRAKYQSLFPGVYITTTVEGSYQNLRRFIREVESSSEFIVISAIELEPAEENKSDEKAAPVTVTKINEFGETVQVTQQPKPTVKGKTRGTVVSLRLELAAYFQRPADQRDNTAVPEADEPVEE